MEHILQMRGVQHQYNGKPVLEIEHLDIATGSITGLAGPNGSGKTTLLKLLALTEPCHSGTIYFREKAAAPFVNNNRHRITLLPQEPYLLKRSVFENIVYGLKIRGETGNVDEAVAQALDLVGLPKAFAGRQWHELSGGEAQRVALAARLALKPSCLLLDEPTASVDMESARNIRQAVFMARKEWGTTLIIASHHRSWLNDICDRIIYLYNGRVLDCSFENVLLGPWRKMEGNRFYKQLADGQVIYVTEPPTPDASSVIDPKHLKAGTAKPADAQQMLTGTVTGIFVDSHFSGPRLHVNCGEERFIASTDSETFSMHNFHPGKIVSLTYRPEDITWLPQ